MSATATYTRRAASPSLTDTTSTPPMPSITRTRPPQPINTTAARRISTSSTTYIPSPLSPYTPSTASPTSSSFFTPPAPEEYVIALHAYAPPPGMTTCIAFQAGDVILVHSKDPQGWWDGSLGSERGWFPSNYVTADLGGWDSSSGSAKSMLDRSMSTRSTRTPTPSPLHQRMSNTLSPPPTTTSRSTPSARSSLSISTSSSVSPSLPSPTAASRPGTLDACAKAVSLLHRAARARRTPHYGPATACVISSVRSVLTAAECLGRDSPALGRFEELAAARRGLLGELGGLVRAAKEAGQEEGEGKEKGEEESEREVGRMLEGAERVLVLVRGLVDTALKCGIDVPGASPIAPIAPMEESASPTPTPTPTPGSTANARAPLRPRVQAAIAAHRAKSLLDLRQHKRAQEADSPTIAASPDLLRSPNPQSQTQPQPGDESDDSSAALVHGGATSKRRIYDRPRVRQGSGSSGSSGGSVSSFASLASTPTAGAASPNPPVVPGPPGPLALTPAQLIALLKQTQDASTSLFAALIGIAQTHTSSGHASSHARLVEIATAAVGKLREAMWVLDAVRGGAGSSTERLGNARRGMYKLAGDVVDAAAGMTAGAGGGEEEAMKATLTRAGFDALRLVGECVLAVKMALGAEGGVVVRLPELLPLEAFVRGVPVASPAGPQARVSRPGSAAGRGRESLDMLAARAARLLALREEYLGEEEEEAVEEEEEEEEEEDEREERESVGFRGRSGTASTQATSVSAHSQPPLRITVGGLPLMERRGSEDSVCIDLRSPTLLSDPTAGRPSLDGPRPSFQLQEKLTNGRLPSVPEDPDDEDPTELLLSPDGLVVGGTLAALVRRITPHSGAPELSFAASFFMTFRMFCAPAELVDALVRRWDVRRPEREMGAMERVVWQDRVLVPVRLRVLNFVKTWLESHWRAETDVAALAPLAFFVESAPEGILRAAARRIADLLASRRLPQPAPPTAAAIAPPPRLDRTKSFDRIRSATPLPFVSSSSSSSATPAQPAPPAPTVSRSLYASLRAASSSPSSISNPTILIPITDFEPLELARQLTIMESKLYIAVRPQELLDVGVGVPAPTVRAITGLSTAVTGLVSECILSEMDMKRRTGILKYFVKVAERANELKNFSLLFAVLAALTSSTILRLSRTWAGLSQKYRVKLEELRKITDYARNYSEYRNRLRETEPCAIPFLGVYLTDITFCNGGNPSHRPSPSAPTVLLINFNKYRKLARIVADMQRFQKSYNLLEIAEAQSYLQHALRESRSSGNLQDLYRRSLLIEPREPPAEPQSAVDSVRSRTDLFGWAARSRSHLNPNPVSA